MIFMISWHCFLRTRLHFLRQYSAMNRQGSARNRQNSDQLLHKYQRQEFSGVRRSSRMRTQSAALRRECWRSVTWFQKSRQKSSWAGILHSYRSREGRRTRPSTGRVASFFASFFSIDFWKAFFQFLLIFDSPWRLQKSPKIAKNRCREVSFFRPDASLALLTDFDWFWVLSGSEKVGFFVAWVVKYASSPKMSFASPRIDFEFILVAFWVPGVA